MEFWPFLSALGLNIFQVILSRFLGSNVTKSEDHEPRVTSFGVWVVRRMSLYFMEKKHRFFKTMNSKNFHVWSYVTCSSISDLLPADETVSATTDTSEDTPVIIILIVCVVGIFLLALNIGLILFFVRRRKKRMESKKFYFT